MGQAMPIGVLIKCITNEYEKQLTKMLSSIGITSSQCAVLNFLLETEKESVNQKDIEEHLNLSNPTVTGLLKRLDEKGYVLIVQSEKDKRRKNVHLTEKAYDIQKRIENDRKKIDRMLLRKMRKNEVESLYLSLEKMLYNIE